MTTLLEYLISIYLGPPSYSKGSGESYWACPLCGNDRFHTMPDKPPYKHRAKCFNSECKLLADAADLLKEFHPDETYSERYDRLILIDREWKARQAKSKATKKSRLSARSKKSTRRRAK